MNFSTKHVRSSFTRRRAALFDGIYHSILFTQSYPPETTCGPFTIWLFTEIRLRIQ